MGQAEARQFELATFERQLAEELEALTDLRGELHLSLENLRSEQASTNLDGEGIARALARIASLNAAIDTQERIVRDLTAQRDEARKRLHDATGVRQIAA